MSSRMTAEAFSMIQKQFPGQMMLVEIEVSILRRFQYRRRRKNAKNPPKKKTEAQKYGVELAAILEWLDDNCNEPFFPKKVSRHAEKTNVVEFFFMEETDAMAFKLMFS